MAVTVESTRHVAALLCATALILSCDDSANLGESCGEEIPCAAELQCLRGVCAPRCERSVECGDGFFCGDDGGCHAVQSEVGQRCERELDCGPGQACTLDSADDNLDGELEATCQLNAGALAEGTRCEADADCRNSLCAQQLCTAVCRETTDCPPTLTCVTLPRLLPDLTSPVFHGCAQSGSVR